MAGFFPKKSWAFFQKKLAPKSSLQFLQKRSTIDFRLNSKYWVLGNTVKKSSHLKDISPVLSKTLCVFILIMYSLFCHKNEKSVLQKKIKD